MSLSTQLKIHIPSPLIGAQFGRPHTGRVRNGPRGISLSKQNCTGAIICVFRGFFRGNCKVLKFIERASESPSFGPTNSLPRWLERILLTNRGYWYTMDAELARTLVAWSGIKKKAWYIWLVGGPGSISQNVTSV